jgi:hypothetical protein
MDYCGGCRGHRKLHGVVDSWKGCLERFCSRGWRDRRLLKAEGCIGRRVMWEQWNTTKRGSVTSGVLRLRGASNDSTGDPQIGTGFARHCLETNGPKRPVTVLWWQLPPWHGQGQHKPLPKRAAKFGLGRLNPSLSITEMLYFVITSPRPALCS